MLIWVTQKDYTPTLATTPERLITLQRSSASRRYALQCSTVRRRSTKTQQKPQLVITAIQACRYTFRLTPWNFHIRSSQTLTRRDSHWLTLHGCWFQNRYNSLVLYLSSRLLSASCLQLVYHCRWKLNAYFRTPFSINFLYPYISRLYDGVLKCTPRLFRQLPAWPFWWGLFGGRLDYCSYASRSLQLQTNSNTSRTNP